MSVLVVSHLSKLFGGVSAIADLSFAVTEKTVYSIIGPNGAGKTTLLNLISGIYRPTSGEIRLFGESVAGRLQRNLRDEGRVGLFKTFNFA